MSTLSSHLMDFETADRIVDRLSEVLQDERRIDGSYFALEWIGAWSLSEVIRALSLVLAMQYRDQFPASQTSKEFADFARLVEGTVAHVQCKAFPMAELAALDRATKDSREWLDLSVVMAEKSVEQFRLGVGTVEGFTTWLLSVNHPHFDDYLAMVNDRIDRFQRV